MLTFLEDLEIEDSVVLTAKMPTRSTLLFHHAKVQDSSTIGDSVLSLPSTLQRLCQNTEVIHRQFPLFFFKIAANVDLQNRKELIRKQQLSLVEL